MTVKHAESDKSSLSWLLRFLFATGLTLTLQGAPCQVGTSELAAMLNSTLTLRNTPEWKTGARKVFTLRHSPLQNEPEMVLIITENQSGAITARVRRLAAPLAAEVDAILRGAPELDCDAAQKRVSVLEAEITGRALRDLSRLYRRMSSIRMRIDVPSELYLDTATYEVYVSSGMADVHLTLCPASTEARRRHPLVPVIEQMLVVVRGTRHTAQAVIP